MKCATCGDRLQPGEKVVVGPGTIYCTAKYCHYGLSRTDHCEATLHRMPTIAGKPGAWYLWYGSMDVQPPKRNVILVNLLDDIGHAAPRDLRYPHTCPKCKGPAYIGLNQVDCKNLC